jgi:hypothetical protein
LHGQTTTRSFPITTPLVTRYKTAHLRKPCNFLCLKAPADPLSFTQASHRAGGHQRDNHLCLSCVRVINTLTVLVIIHLRLRVRVRVIIATASVFEGTDLPSEQFGIVDGRPAHALYHTSEPFWFVLISVNIWE